MKTKLFTLLFVLMASVGTMFAENGTCGENLTWDLTNGILTISGSGEMTVGHLTTMDGTILGEGPHWAQYMEYIAHVSLPEGLTSIADASFGCIIGNGVEICPNLISVDIPKNVTKIGKYAFYGCSTLSVITCNAINPPTLGEDVFDGVNTSTCMLYVPSESIDLYRKADGWKAFTNILPIGGEEPSVLPTHSFDLDLTQIPIMDWSVTNATLNGEESDETRKRAYDIKAGVPGIAYAYEEPNVQFISQNSADKPKAFTITDQFFMFGTKNGIIKIMNTVAGDSIILTVAAKGSSSASLSDPEGVYPKNAVVVSTDLTLPAKDKTSVESDGNGYIWREIEYISTGGDVEIKETAAGFCVKRIVVGKKSYQIGDLYYSLDYENSFAVVIENPKEKYSGDIVIPESISVEGKQYNVQIIDYMAFANCTELNFITCESTTPPSCRYNTFQGVDSMLPIYVPKESVESYQNAAVWSYFKNINSFEAEEVPVVEPTAEPTSNTVVIEWPKNANAATYIIVIKKGNETICTLEFDAQGQLLDFAYAAPERKGVHRQTRAAMQTSMGWKYIINGLDANTEYTYIVTAKKSDNSVVYEQSIPFKTQGTSTGIDTTNPESEPKVHKILRDGQILILRGEKTYTLQGQEVR